MDAFKNILVGIDIDENGELAIGSQSAVKQAILLAKNNKAAVSFVHVMDMPAKMKESIKAQPDSAPAIEHRRAEVLLKALAEDATGLNVKTTILYGPHWRELILAVQSDGHDLVIVGTRGRGIAGRALFGSTGNRLLRLCPCPVWSVKPMEFDQFNNILVAHDRTGAGELALSLAAGMARIQNSTLHVLHIVEHPEDKRFLGQVSGEEVTRREESARVEIQGQCDKLQLDNPVDITIRSGDAYAEILAYVNKHNVDLLCMGTIARSGLAGLVTGNTAENVLPWISCSLIAIKPESFVSPLAGK